jgi:hypothetical protein
LIELKVLQIISQNWAGHVPKFFLNCKLNSNEILFTALGLNPEYEARRIREFPGVLPILNSTKNN